MPVRRIRFGKSSRLRSARKEPIAIAAILLARRGVIVGSSDIEPITIIAERRDVVPRVTDSKNQLRHRQRLARLDEFANFRIEAIDAHADEELVARLFEIV